MRIVNVTSAAAGHAAPITHVDLRPDGRRLASSSYDGSVIVWDCTDPAGPAELARLYHRRLVNASSWNPARPDLLATASADKTVVVWDLAGSPTVHSTLARHTDDVNSVAWMPDGRRLICVSEDGRATMWDADSGAFLDSVSTHAAHCMMVAVNGDGRVATVGEDGMVAVFDPDHPEDRITLHYASSVEGCAWSHAGDRLAVARDDGHLDVLTATLEPVLSVPVSSSAARAVAWSADDATLVVGAYDGSFHLVGADGARLGRVDDERAWPRSVAAVGDVVALGSFWSSPQLVDFTGREVAAPAAPTHGPNALVCDGTRLLVGCDSGLVIGVPPDGNGPVSADRLCDGPILSLDTAPDGTVFAGTYSGRVVRWDGAATAGEPTGAPLPSLLHRGATVLAGSYNGEHLSVRADSLVLAERRVVHEGSVKSMAALDGADFVSCATDRSVTAGDEDRRSLLWTHGNLVNSVAALDGSVVASASRDHTVKVGRVRREADGWTAGPVLTLLGPDESVKCVGLLGDPESPIVLAGSYDFGLWCWRVDWSAGASVLRTGVLLAEFEQGVSCICRVGDDTAAVAGWDGRIRIVRADPSGSVGVTAEYRVEDLVRRAEPAGVVPA